MTDDAKPDAVPCGDCGYPEAVASMHETMKTGFAEMHECLSHSAIDRQEIHAELRVIREEQALMRSQIAMLRDHPSSSDLKVESDLASEIIARKELAEKVDNLTRIAQRFEAGWDKAMANPRTKLVLAILGVAIWQWLSTHGLHLPALPGAAP